MAGKARRAGRKKQDFVEGDGDNDNWQVYFSQTEPDITVLIFDRYGKLLKQLNALSDGWDGTFKGENAPEAVYLYLIKAQCTGEDEKLYKGNVTLLR